MTVPVLIIFKVIFLRIRSIHSLCIAVECVLSIFCVCICLAFLFVKFNLDFLNGSNRVQAFQESSHGNLVIVLVSENLFVLFTELWGSFIWPKPISKLEAEASCLFFLDQALGFILALDKRNKWGGFLLIVFIILIFSWFLFEVNLENIKITSYFNRVHIIRQQTWIIFKFLVLYCGYYIDIMILILKACCPRIFSDSALEKYLFFVIH